MKKSFLLLALLAAGCAKMPDEIQAVAVSADPYMAMECPQLSSEKVAAAAELARLEEAQLRAAQQDQAAMAVIHVPVASMRGKDQEAAVASAKGKVSAVNQAYAAKGCS
ncbi:MAG: hypothetical protein RLZZ444_1841 [Pseudomonadota bacterium]|jgi:starvation-inducible outer membrane lipoprotein